MITSFADAATTLIKVLDVVGDNDNQKEADLLLSRGSLTRFLSQFIVEPQIKVSRSLKGHEHVQNLINAEVDIFTSLYQTAFNIMLDVYGFDTKFAIQILASKDFIAEKISAEDSGDLFVNENTKKVNAFLNNEDTISPLHMTMDTEADKKTPIEKVFKEVILTANVGSNNSVGGGSDNKKAREIRIRILVAASIQYVAPESIYNLIEVEGDMNSMSSRFDDMRAGVISKMNFFIPLDVISQYKQNRLKDKDDILASLSKRKTVSASKLISNQALGFARFYQIINVTDAERERIEHMVNGNMEKKRYKEKVLEFSKSLILASMDDNFETVDLFIHDLEDEVTLTYKALKNSDKSDTSEILKFLANRQY